MKLCKDCIHQGGGFCLHPSNIRHDYMTGKPLPRQSIEYCRDDGHCVEAANFESMDDLDRNTERDERAPSDNHVMTEDQRLDDPRRG